MEADSLILDWDEGVAPLTPPQSDKGDQDKGPLYVFPVPTVWAVAVGVTSTESSPMLTLGSLDRLNDEQDNSATIQDMAALAFVLKVQGVQDVVLSSYHRIFSDGFLEGWKQATAMSMGATLAHTISPSVSSTSSDMAVNFSVSSPTQPATIIHDLTDTLINTTIATLEAETNPVEVAAIEPEQILLENIDTPIDSIDTSVNNTNIPFDTTISATEPEQTPIENFDTPIGSTSTIFNNTNTIINTAQPLIDLTPPDTYRPYRSQSYPHPHRPYPFLPPHTNKNLQRPYIPTTPLYGIPPPCEIIPILPSLSPAPQPPYPNLTLPASLSSTTPTSSTTPPTTTTPSPSPCLLTTTHTPSPISTPLPSLLLGPVPPAALLDWATTSPHEPHAYFAEKLEGNGGDRIHSSEYVDGVDTGAVYMRLTFWEAGGAERAMEVFRGGYACGGGVVWGWAWRG